MVARQIGMVTFPSPKKFHSVLFSLKINLPSYLASPQALEELGRQDAVKNVTLIAIPRTRSG